MNNRQRALMEYAKKVNRGKTARSVYSNWPWSIEFETKKKAIEALAYLNRAGVKAERKKKIVTVGE